MQNDRLHLRDAEGTSQTGRLNQTKMFHLMKELDVKAQDIHFVTVYSVKRKHKAPRDKEHDGTTWNNRIHCNYIVKMVN